MPTNHPNQLNPDWLDALGVVRRIVPNHDITKVWKTYIPLFVFASSYTTAVIVDVFSTDDFVGLAINIPDFDQLPKIERMEVLIYAALMAWCRCTPGLYDLSTLCKEAGVCEKNTPDIRERWRLATYYVPHHLLPYANWEDRPKCAVCEMPMATGSYTLKESIWAADAHEECERFAHWVMLPAILDQPPLYERSRE